MYGRSPAARGHVRICDALIILAFVCVITANIVLCIDENGQSGNFRIDGEPDRPKWPDQYVLRWSLAIPYMKELQPQGLTYIYKAWQDTPNNRLKMERDGVEVTLKLHKEGKMFEVVPRIDHLFCRETPLEGLAATKLTNIAASRKLLQTTIFEVLPDLADPTWQYNGTAEFGGKGAHRWLYVQTNDEGYGVVSRYYEFLTSEDGVPLTLDMYGHFDRYIAVYLDYNTNPIPESEFDIPKVCLEEATRSQSPGDMNSRHDKLEWRALAHLPNPYRGDERYDSWALQYNRRHSHWGEYEQGRQTYHENARKIAEHNEKAEVSGSSHRLSLNQFADWTQEEYLATMAPTRGRKRPEAMFKPGGLFKPTMSKELLPRTVDWRHTTLDMPVKDQAKCGSCWAFGTTASLEVAHAKMAGKQLLLSEQYLIDCNWEAAGNFGCWGGFPPLAYAWLFNDTNGISSAASYPYQGVSNFCKKDAKLDIRFKGRWVWVEGGEHGLMEALYKVGPMMVSFDNEHEEFKFYSSGIFNITGCEYSLLDLDHIMVAVGYGTTEAGEDYWLLKNSWSPVWGEKGYIRVARKPNDCGVAVQPIYVELEDMD